MQLLREFREALDEHVSIENDVLFPMAIKLESMMQR
jgi:regulator of cell morphogenesis and NO signaling